MAENSESQNSETISTTDLTNHLLEDNDFKDESDDSCSSLDSFELEIHLADRDLFPSDLIPEKELHENSKLEILCFIIRFIRR